MTKNSVFSLLTASLAILTVIPGRFAYGLIALILLNVLLFAGIITRFALCKSGYEKYFRLILLPILTCLTIFFQQMLYLFSAVIAVTMSFSLYIVCFSTLLMGILFTDAEPSIAVSLTQNFKRSLLFTVMALLFFVLRDFLGFGTISFPILSGLYEISFFNSFDGIVFFGSIPGAFMLLAIILVIEYFARLTEKRS